MLELQREDNGEWETIKKYDDDDVENAKDAFKEFVDKFPEEAHFRITQDGRVLIKR